MKVENSKMVSVHYTLTVDGQIADQSREGQPLQFICGAGMLLPKFEGAIMGKEPGEKVSFTLAPADGYGEIQPEAIVDLPKTIFMVDGKFDEEAFYPGALAPMMTADGYRIDGLVQEVKPDSVVVDFNHPLAKDNVRLKGEVTVVRDATPEELQPSHGCGGGCGGGCCGGESSESGCCGGGCC